MILYYSGQDAVLREVPETVLENSTVMLSFNTAVYIQKQDKSPKGRLQRLIRARRKAKKNEGK